MRGKSKRKISWKVPNTSGTQETFRNPQPKLNLIHHKPTTSPMWDIECLVPGSLFFVKYDMSKEDYSQNWFVQPLHPYLTMDYPGFNSAVKVGEVAVFFGTERVEEMGKNAAPVRSVRHVFVINGAKYFVRNLDAMTPANSVLKK